MAWTAGVLTLSITGAQRRRVGSVFRPNAPILHLGLQDLDPSWRPEAETWFTEGVMFSSIVEGGEGAGYFSFPKSFPLSVVVICSWDETLLFQKHLGDLTTSRKSELPKGTCGGGREEMHSPP